MALLLVTHLLRLLLVGALLAGGASAAWADAQARRIALVIGNGNYRAAPQLANPPNDARLMARTLAALGFTLVGGGPRINLDKAAFAAAVRAFGQALPGAEVALFYYAGHGVQVDGTNWLVPVDANPSRLQDLDFQMVDAGLVLRQMDGAGARLNVLVLDACRNNPFGGRGFRGSEPGLAQMRAPEGTVISYATQPGNIASDGDGADSPFSQALAEAMQQPGLDVFQTFNRVGLAVKRATGGVQQPWVSASPIEGQFYFAGVGAGAVPPPPLPAAPAASVPGRSSTGLLARVAAAARPDNLPVPQFITIEPPAANVPPEMARFVGVWGPGDWNGGSHKIMLIVERVDPDGGARLIVMLNAACAEHGCREAERQPRLLIQHGSIENGRLGWVTDDGYTRYELEFAEGGQLHATAIRGPKSLTTRAVLPRFE